MIRLGKFTSESETGMSGRGVASRAVGNELGSAAMKADAKQADFCTYLSAILLAGLLLNAAFGIWWADSVAALKHGSHHCERRI